GGHDEELAAQRIEEVEELAVARLRWDIRIDQRDTQSQGRALGKIRFDEAGPILRDFAGDLGVAVTGEVGENQLRLRLPGPANLKKVDAAGAPRSRTGAGQLGAG